MAAARVDEGDGCNTGSPVWRRGTRQPTTREGKAGPDRVAERLVLPGKPGNAGGGKEPQVEAMAKGSRLTGVAEWPITPEMSRNAGCHHMHKRRGRPERSPLSGRQQA